MPVRGRGRDAAARRAGEQPDPDEERLDDRLDRLRLLADGDRERVEADRSAVEAGEHDVHHGAVEAVEAELVDVVEVECGADRGDVGAAAVHRAAVLGESDPVARPVDTQTIVDVLRGKVEFESGEEGREIEVLNHLLRRATADTARDSLGGIDLGPLVTAVEQGEPVITGDRVTAKVLLNELPDLPVIDEIAERLPDMKVQASGGVSTLTDLERLRTDGAIIGKALWEGRIALEEALGLARA